MNDPNAVAWQWNTGAATQSIDVYQKGTYTVKVTGQGGCTETATAIVTYLTPVSGSIAGLKQGLQRRNCNAHCQRRQNLQMGRQRLRE